MNNHLKAIIGAALTALLLVGPGCASTPRHESTGEYVDDSVITVRVKAAIVKDPTLSAAEINVETFKGQVQLSGFVHDAADVAKASEVARNVEGVKSVVNSLVVKG
jgi:osmotically-inducible protein OsmY